jgi:hypothetical protein
MKKIIVLVAAICFALVGLSDKVMAGPVPISAQEGAQLNELASNDALLTLKAGGSFPNAPMALEATEESALKNLQAGSPNLPALKAGGWTRRSDYLGFGHRPLHHHLTRGGCLIFEDGLF